LSLKASPQPVSNQEVARVLWRGDCGGGGVGGGGGDE
jgi:hypothetical protein